MDERQTRIREGAGLEEARLNTDFIDWLRKWSTPILVLIAAVALGFVLYERYERSRTAEVNRAFAELDAQLEAPTPSPEALKRVAQEFEGVRGVSVLARLHAADAYRHAVRTGLKPGAAPGPDGSHQPEDVLGEEERARLLAEAEELYSRVLRDSSGKRGMTIHAIGALYGLAAIAETRADDGSAKRHYEQIIALATAAAFGEQATLARQRLEDLGSMSAAPRLYAASELPGLPWANEPSAPGGFDLNELMGDGPSFPGFPDGPPELPPDLPAPPGDPAEAAPARPAEPGPAGADEPDTADPR